MAGTQEHEIPLLIDVFMATAIDNESFAGHGGTECNCEGPFYVPGAPRLELPYVLPKREEDGETLRFSGTVRSLDGSPLAGALLDVWQANGNKEYPPCIRVYRRYNLRGQFTADGEGRFEFETGRTASRTRCRTPGRPGSCWQRLAGCRGVPLTSTSRSRTRTLRC